MEADREHAVLYKVCAGLLFVIVCSRVKGLLRIYIKAHYGFNYASVAC